MIGKDGTAWLSLHECFRVFGKAISLSKLGFSRSLDSYPTQLDSYPTQYEILLFEVDTTNENEGV